jgi:hypothetical protein
VRMLLQDDLDRAEERKTRKIATLHELGHSSMSSLILERHERVSKSFWTESVTKYALTIINPR